MLLLSDSRPYLLQHLPHRLRVVREQLRVLLVQLLHHLELQPLDVVPVARPVRLAPLLLVLRPRLLLRLRPRLLLHLLRRVPRRLEEVLLLRHRLLRRPARLRSRLIPVRHVLVYVHLLFPLQYPLD